MVRSQREGGHSRKRGYAGGRYADLSKPKYNWTHQHHHKYKYKCSCKYNNKYKNKCRYGDPQIQILPLMANVRYILEMQKCSENVVEMW